MDAIFSCSIDDGHPFDMKVAEILHKRGIRGTFYIPISNREGMEVLSNYQIRQIGNEFDVGSHTYDHCYLKGIPLSDAWYQITHGKIELEDILQRKVKGFCYPGGKYSRDQINLVQSAGFLYARTTTNLCFNVGNQPFEMPTTIQFYPHTRDIYLRNFVKGAKWLERHEGLRVALKHRHWIERLYALFEHSIENKGIFHLWGHSKDIDDLNAWQEFDEFLAHVATRISIHNRVSNAQLAALDVSAINQNFSSHEDSNYP